MQVYGELIRAMLQISASDLTPTATGLVYFNTTSGPKFYDGSTWRIFADTSSTQTFTGKTIDGDDNTVQDLALTSLKTVAGDANKILQRDASGIVISDDKLTLKEISTPSTPSANTVALYAKSDGKIYRKDDTGTEAEVGSGSGSGSRNYFSDYFDGLKPVGTVTNGLTATGNRAANQGTWGADDTTKLTIANNTSSPLRQTGDFKITHVGVGTAFVETPMVNLDTADLGKAVTISFDLTGNTTSGDFDIVVIRYNSGGTYQETISVAGTASSGSPASALLPTGTTKFTGFFIASNTQTDYYSLRFRRLSGSATTSPQFDSLFVGPQSIITGAIITDPLSYTPSNTQGFGTISSVAVAWRRVGSNLHLAGRFTTGTVAASEAQFSLPTGLTVATFAGSSAIRACGKWEQSNATGNSVKQGVVLCTPGDSFLNFSSDDYPASTNPFVEQNGNAIFLSATAWTFCGEVIVPIAEWSGSNTTLAERAVEAYASNSGIGGTNANTDYTVGSVEGPSGSQFVAVNSTDNTNGFTTRYAVSFSNPILQTTLPILEITEDSGSTWMQTSRVTFTSKINANNAVYGMWIEPRNSSSVWVVFGNAGRQQGSTYGSVGISWGGIAGSSQYKWRVRAVNGGASVGYPVSASNIVINHNSTATADTLKSGTYTPTSSSPSNCTVNTVNSFRYMQVGKTVYVSGICSVSATASSGCEFFLTLPITTDLTGAHGQLSGTASHAQVGALYAPGGVLGDAASDKAQIVWRSNTDTASRELYINFMYLLA